MKFVQALPAFCAVMVPAMADVVNVSPSKLEFGNQVLTTSSTQSVVLSNPTKQDLNILSVAADSGFLITFNSCRPVLPAGNQCTISVTFAPTATGLLSGTLRIDDDSNQTPEKVKLSGTGVPVQLTSISITPGSPAIAAGLTQQFAATGNFNNGTVQDLTSTATWTSSATGIATIAGGGLATSFHQGTTTIKAISDAVSGSAILTVGPPVLQSIVITPASPKITAGTTQQFTATGSYSDQTTENLTNSVQWRSSTTGVATVSATGLVTAVSLGIYPNIFANIFASSGSVVGFTGLEVIPPLLVSIAITPANPSVGLGLSLQLTATGTYNNGSTANITNSVAWGPIYLVSAGGVATGVFPGNFTIEAFVSSGIIGTTNLEIGGTFAGVFPMSAVRYFHTATTLNNGKVLLTGGGSSIASPSLLASTEMYDPVAKTFTGGTAGMTNPRMRHTATLLSNGRVLVAGGTGAYGPVATAEIFDPGTLNFASTGGLSAARTDHTATLLLTGQVLIAGGANATAELYDPGTGAFTATGGMASSRRGHTATLLNSGLVLVTGGTDGSGLSSATAEIYNPGTGQFTPIPGMTTARAFHRATLLNGGKVLLSGGFNGASRPAAAELYDPAAGFAATGLMNAPRDTHTATLLTNGQVLIAGGEASSGPLGITEKYDPSSGTFSLTAINNDHFDPTRIGHTATLLSNGQVLVAGGASVAGAGLYQPSVYTPPGLSSISVTPSNASIAVGSSQRFVGTGTFLDGTVKSLASCLWASSNNAIVVVTNDTGSPGIATGVSAGTASIGCVPPVQGPGNPSGYTMVTIF